MLKARNTRRVEPLNLQVTGLDEPRLECDRYCETGRETTCLHTPSKVLQAVT